MSNNNNNENKTDDEWRAILSPQQFAVLRQKHTEAPGTGEYTHTFDKGVYGCGACGTPLYKSSTKFDAHCGWPAFYEALPGAVKCIDDNSLGMTRTEIVCSKCNSHLGHVFRGEGFDTPTDERHCVNSISLKLNKD
ncbi:Peptide methionine sulfoxide reductase B2, chloroplastic [Coemansia erecta]|nr:Peptide methionine sulfoxide reductase B2, chloroplastic [Coemansia sp. RSA 2618]KAJ2827542.1 Peptide methionine sulfoxide reductase B2, chloroplastic [Coemansia erecta]